MKMMKESAESINLSSEQMVWFEKYIHRVRDIVKSEPGHQTLYAFKDGGTHTSYSIQKKYKKDSPASYVDWLGKLLEIQILCRYDQDDDLKEWGKKKVYAINPANKEIAKLIIDVIQKKYYSPSI